MAALYGFSYMPQALAYLKTIPHKLRAHIIKKIKLLSTNPKPRNCKMVIGMSGGEDQVYRVRSGNYRVLYVVKGIIVVVLDIEHRKDIYR